MFQAFVEHIHRSEMQRRWVVCVRRSRFLELFGYLPFGIAENDTSLTLSLSLRLHGHGIFKRGRNEYVLDLHGNDPDPQGSVR